MVSPAAVPARPQGPAQHPRTSAAGAGPAIPSGRQSWRGRAAAGTGGAGFAQGECRAALRRAQHPQRPQQGQQQRRKARLRCLEPAGIGHIPPAWFLPKSNLESACLNSPQPSQQAEGNLAAGPRGRSLLLAVRTLCVAPRKPQDAAHRRSPCPTPAAAGPCSARRRRRRACSDGAERDGARTSACACQRDHCCSRQCNRRALLPRTHNHQCLHGAPTGCRACARAHARPHACGRTPTLTGPALPHTVCTA